MKILKQKRQQPGLLLGCLLLILFFSQLVDARASDQVPEQKPTFANEVLKGDFNAMVERRQVRALVTYSKTFYFHDKGRQKGLIYEELMQFEKFINKKLNKKNLKVNVIFIPAARDRLLPDLLAGRGDIAAANLTITPERQEQVDFSNPLLTGVKELVVSSPCSPKIVSLEDLSGKEIHVRESSSYYQSLQRLNARFKEEGKRAVRIVAADENLEDEDLLEMLNAGLIPLIVVDSHKAKFWDQIFGYITVHEDVAVASESDIAWAFRKDSPELKAVVNEYVEQNKAGTLIGNILFKRYLKSTAFIKNSTSEVEIEKFRKTIDLFKKYAGQYGFDYLMITAQAYQESQIDQSKKSPAGAIGVMQVLPSTAADKNVNIPGIHELENNINAGTKYMRFISDRYFADDSIDQQNRLLLSFASYNAGPAKIAKFRKEAEEQGLDPNKWFQNVELVAAKRIGRETVQYVSNIYKYWIAYSMVVEREKMHKAASGELDGS
ncbi:MAG: lytic transglycosylase F [Thermodesulfobacteriota bacterium]